MVAVGTYIRYIAIASQVYSHVVHFGGAHRTVNPNIPGSVGHGAQTAAPPLECSYLPQPLHQNPSLPIPISPILGQIFLVKARALLPLNGLVIS